MLLQIIQSPCSRGLAIQPSLDLRGLAAKQASASESGIKDGVPQEWGEGTAHHMRSGWATAGRLYIAQGEKLTAAHHVYIAQVLTKYWCQR